MSDVKTVLIALFDASPQLRLIDFFMDNRNHDFSGHEIRKAVKMSSSTFYRYFPRLLEMEVIRVSRKAGKTRFYMLDSNSLISQTLLSLEAEFTKPAGPTTVCGGCGRIVVMKTTLTPGGYQVQTCPKCGYRVEEPDEDE